MNDRYGASTIDAGALPTRYRPRLALPGPGRARSGTAARTRCTRSAPSSSSSPTRPGRCTCSTGTAGTWAATSPRARSRATRSPARSMTGAGAGDGKCAQIPYARRVPPAAQDQVLADPGAEQATVRLERPEGNAAARAGHDPARSRARSPPSGRLDLGPILIENCNCREVIDNVVDMAHFFYIHFAFPTFFKNVLRGPRRRAVPDAPSPGRTSTAGRAHGRRRDNTLDSRPPTTARRT